MQFFATVVYMDRCIVAVEVLYWWVWNNELNWIELKLIEFNLNEFNLI